MHRLQYLIAVSSILFSLLIGFNCLFGTYGIRDTAEVKASIARMKENEDVLKKISATLSAMKNDYASDDFCLLEGRKLSMYMSDDVAVQIDGYTKKGLSEEYGNITVVSRPSDSSVIRVLYSIAGSVAFFSFLIYSIFGGAVRGERKPDYSRPFRSYHSGSR